MFRRSPLFLTLVLFLALAGAPAIVVARPETAAWYAGIGSQVVTEAPDGQRLEPALIAALRDDSYDVAEIPITETTHGDISTPCEVTRPTTELQAFPVGPVTGR